MFETKSRSDIAIRTCHHRYVTALAHDSGWLLAALSPRILGWENFTLVHLGNDYVALKTAHGTYVTALAAQDRWSLRGTADRILGWEIFKLESGPSNPQPDQAESAATPQALHKSDIPEFQAFLKTPHGRYVRACESPDSYRLRGDSPRPGPECVFSFLLL